MLGPLVAFVVAFNGPQTALLRARGSAGSEVAMSSRREVVSSAALLVGALPLSAFADGASSAYTRQKAYAIYGQRILDLQESIQPNTAFVKDAVNKDINAITLFTTGMAWARAQRKGARSLTAHDPCRAGAVQGDTQKQLMKIKKDILKAADADDAPAVKEGLNQFIAVGKIRRLGDDNVFALNERRNLGAPTTDFLSKQTGRAQDFKAQ